MTQGSPKARLTKCANLNSPQQRRWHSNGEIVLPLLQGCCAMWGIGILRRAFGWPVSVDALGVVAAAVGFGFFVYRFFATTKPTDKA